MNHHSSPVPSSYWVRHGHLLAGAYPSVRDNRALSRERIAQLLAVPIATFIDLTEDGERESYLSLAQHAAVQCGITITHWRMAIRDYDTPSVAQMTRILDALDASLAAGHATYLHCWGGIGRTGTVVGCYLVRHGMSGDQALRVIRQWRRDALCGEMPSPETAAQRQFVLEWKG